MELIKEFSSKGMKHVRYDFNDSELIKDRFKLSDKVATELCDHLKKTKNTIDVKDTFDPQSGWSGHTFEIEGYDISINGYCFSKKNLRDYLLKTTKFKNHNQDKT